MYGYFLVYCPLTLILVLNVPRNGRLGQFDFRARFQGSSRNVTTLIYEGFRIAWTHV
jgi:hypothetical protein